MNRGTSSKPIRVLSSFLFSGLGVLFQDILPSIDGLHKILDDVYFRERFFVGDA